MTAPTAPTAPITALPRVRVLIHSAMLSAGVSVLLSSAGFPLAEQAEEADVLVVDDDWLDELDTLESLGMLGDAPAVVALGSMEWVSLLPELSSSGWAALPADATTPELLAGVMGAAAGLAVLPSAQVITRLDLPDASETSEDDPAGSFAAETSQDINLTPREREVLNLLTEGLSNKRAAKELGVSESTVKFHVQAIYGKLGVQSRAGAVSRGIQLGLVSV